MKKLSELKTPEERRGLLKEKLNIKLNAVSQVLIDEQKDIHCENLIGATTIPLGVAGPLKVQNAKLKVQNYYIPLATTEGALVASVNRGCKAITESGGAKTNAHRVGTTRGPVFCTESIRGGQKFFEWVKKNEATIKKTAEKTSSHLTFKKADVKTVADYAFMRIYFNTDEAMGMNMATIATQAICKFIEKKTGFACVSVAGNYDSDKKPAWINFINNRGIKVWAETTVSIKVLKTILKTTPQKFFDVWYAKCVLGSIMSGSLGFNSHFANVIAALFIATGQDPAHVAEGSMGITTTKLMPDGGVYVSVYLPDLMIGTVGGGTKLKTQQEALHIIGAKNVVELAEIVGATVLAGEVSLLASLAEGSLASSHKKLGR